MSVQSTPEFDGDASQDKSCSPKNRRKTTASYGKQKSKIIAKVVTCSAGGESYRTHALKTVPNTRTCSAGSVDGRLGVPPTIPSLQKETKSSKAKSFTEARAEDGPDNLNHERAHSKTTRDRVPKSGSSSSVAPELGSSPNPFVRNRRASSPTSADLQYNPFEESLRRTLGKLNDRVLQELSSVLRASEELTIDLVKRGFDCAGAHTSLQTSAGECAGGTSKIKAEAPVQSAQNEASAAPTPEAVPREDGFAEIVACAMPSTGTRNSMPSTGTRNSSKPASQSQSKKTVVVSKEASLISGTSNLTAHRKSTERGISSISPMWFTSTGLGRQFSRGFSRRPSSGNNIYQTTALIPDLNQLKRSMKNEVLQSDESRCLYKEKGWTAGIARSKSFETVTLLIIALNAVWLGVETDTRDDAKLYTMDDLSYLLMDNFFCTFFVFEWVVKLAAFKSKPVGFKDPWFLFDTALVAQICVDTWLLCALNVLLEVDRSNNGPWSVLKSAKLFRVFRAARLVRLMRSCPELLMLIKSVGVALRSVFFTFVLLAGVTYMFAIAMVNSSTSHNAALGRFVLNAMRKLLLYALVPDLFDFYVEVKQEGALSEILFCLFSFCVIITLLNMLIGLMCEVVHTMSAAERDKQYILRIRDGMLALLKNGDADSNGKIALAEFISLIQDDRTKVFLASVDIDALALVDYADVLFQNGHEYEYLELINIMIQFRGSNTATVKDIVDLRRWLHDMIKDLGNQSPNATSQLNLGDLGASTLSFLYQNPMKDNTRQSNRQSEFVFSRIGDAFKSTFLQAGTNATEYSPRASYISGDRSNGNSKESGRTSSKDSSASYMASKTSSRGSRSKPNRDSFTGSGTSTHQLCDGSSDSEDQAHASSESDHVGPHVE